MKKIKNKNKKKIEKELDIGDIYTSLPVAKKEILRRWNDKELRMNVEKFLGKDLPEVFKKRPKAIFSRYVTTPNFEFSNFLSLAHLIDLPPACIEYSKDKFVAKNSAKYYLARMFFYNGEGKKGGLKHSTHNLVDFNKWEGKLLSEVKTISGGNLINFHHKALKKTMLKGVKCEICDFSDWFKKRRYKTKYYYLHYLALFLVNGVLFENFLLDKEEGLFTKDKVIPSFQKIEKMFGIRPLIVPLESIRSEKDHRWYYYSEATKNLLEKDLEEENPSKSA